MTQQELQKRLNQPYSTENWKEVVKEVFPNVQLLNPVMNIPVNNDKVESFKQLGNVRLNDGKTLALFELKLKSNVNILRNRVELNNLVSQYIDQDQNHGVLSIFEKGGEDYRFTFSARATEFDEQDGDFVTKKTDTKRFTYLLGKNESCKTPSQRLYELSTKKAEADINTIQDAFSVEKLSNEFFRDYKVHYQRMVDYLIESPSYKSSIFNGNEKAIRDFVKLTLGRLVFIQFLQKKRWMGVPANESGWTGGNPNFLSKSYNSFPNKEVFYSQFLEPLFFETLNQDHRPNHIFKVTGTKVPYLNGGLFEKGRENSHLINFPEAFFDELFEFFGRYNFTIDESDPKEQEVGIDPEMLGHIFENLLEDNKDKGAFYTPKEIVHYMCQESLLEYLKTFLEEKGQWPATEEEQDKLEESLSNFIKKKEGSGVIDLDRELAIALRDVKICDPAIGSGAFPMGLLNEIFHSVFILFQASPDVVGEEWGMEDWKPNLVKKNIIQNSIYGVDIEKGAVDIARLRFWLSLIVDEPEPEALPNLDYKIVVGNSLISRLGDTVIDIDWNLNETSHGLFGADLAKRKGELLKKISEEQKEYFNPESDKKKLAIDIRDLKIDLLINQLELMVKTKGIETSPTGSSKSLVQQTNLYLQTLDWKKSINQLQKLKSQSEKSLSFFDWKLDFPELLNKLVIQNPGFDIVIGNPPYVEAKKLKEISRFLKGYKVYSGTADLSSYFFELGINLCKKNGNLCLINTNKFFNTGYGKPLRLLIIENEIKQLLNFEQVEVFEGILVSSVILNLKKTQPRKNNIFPFKKFYKLKNTDFIKTFIEEIRSRDSYNQNDLTDKEWSFADSSNLGLKLKIEKNSTKLKDLKGVNVYRGVTTGYNPAFIININDKKELINQDIKNSEIIKPLLQGRNIRKWIYNFNDEFLIFTKLGIEIENYPAVKNHLEKFYDELKPRNNGEEVGRKPGSYKWYEIQDNTAYFKEFEKPKIIWGLTADKWAYAYDESNHYLPSNGYILTSEIISPKYLLAVINSALLRYYFGFIGIMTAGGAFTLKHSTILELPIKIASNPKVFIDEVDKILNQISREKYNSNLDQKIDTLVYRLYELSFNDVKIIDPDFNLSEVEYDAITLE